jgi:hypothetical protein
MLKQVFSILSLLAAVAHGQTNTTNTTKVCDFQVVMFSNTTGNNCFEGWPINQAANLAVPLVLAWREKEHPELIPGYKKDYSVPTLTQAQYDALDEVGKKAYERAQKDWGFQVGFDKTYAYHKDKCYRTGWAMEYTNHTNTTNATAYRMAQPHATLPAVPGPLPTAVTGPTIWWVNFYKRGWTNGIDQGCDAGLREGKANGKIARERGDDFLYAYTTGYSKGYDDAKAGLSSSHRRLNNQNGGRRLRGVGSERQLTEHRFTNGYASGYETAQRELEQKHKKQQRQRHLSSPILSSCTAMYPNVNTYKFCQAIGYPAEDEGATTLPPPPTTLTHNFTLTSSGITGGADFKKVLTHVLATKCTIADVGYQVWKVCPKA